MENDKEKKITSNARQFGKFWRHSPQKRRALCHGPRELEGTWWNTLSHQTDIPLSTLFFSPRLSQVGVKGTQCHENDQQSPRCLLSPLKRWALGQGPRAPQSHMRKRPSGQYFILPDEGFLLSLLASNTKMAAGCKAHGTLHMHNAMSVSRSQMPAV